MTVEMAPPGRTAPPPVRRRLSTRVFLDAADPVRVVDDPYTSVLALACAGLRDRAAGRATAFAGACGSLTHDELTALGRVVAPGASLSPDCLTPVIDLTPAGSPSTTMDAHVDRLRSTSCADLEDDLQETFGGHLPPRWDAVRQDPRRWLHDVVDGLETLWEAVAPEWRRQRHLRDGEARRIGLATVTGTLGPALADAHPRGRPTRTGFEFPDPDGIDGRVDGRTLVLTPLLAGLHLTVTNLDRRDVVYFAYPARPEPVPDPEARQGLGALLTASRATLLRLADGDHSMSHLARTAHLSPAAVTHHVDWLERSGLVERHRDGRTVRVSATPRGRRLLELYPAERT